MTLSRILKLAAAVAAVAAASAVCVVAAAFAVYALAEAYVGGAGAAAVVTGVFALIALAVAWAATRKVAPRPGTVARSEDAGLLDRAMGLARDRPIVALGAAAVAAAVLLRNPTLIGALVSAFLAGGAAKPKR